MITYEYKCGSCNKEFELIRSIGDDSEDIECPECKSSAARHFRTAPNIDTYFVGSTKDQHPVPGI